MKIFAACDKEVTDRITGLLKKFHPEMVKHEVTVGALFCYDDEDENKPCVMLHGRECLAVVQIVSAKNRAAGMPDALITIDRGRYQKAASRRRESLLAHELHHLILKPKEVDGAGRPKLVMREHDRQFGWFDEIAKRYGDDAWEIIQAREMIKDAGQLYFGIDYRSDEVVTVTREQLKSGAPVELAATGK